MKKLLFILGISVCIISCKPSIDSALDKLETAYIEGNEQKAEKIWERLWDRQNEMSMAQVDRYIKLTEKYDPEWHYDDIDDGQPENQIDFYFAHYRKEEPKPVSRSYSYSSGGSLSYYECSNCGLVLKSSSQPKPNSGTCKYSYHNWHRLCNVGSQHIVRCQKCGLELQCDDETYRINGGKCYDGSQHKWIRAY